MKELESAIKGLKKRKAPGLYGVNVELSKYCIYRHKTKTEKKW